MMKITGSAPLLVLLAACQPGGDVPDTSRTQAYSGIGENEKVRFTGTEPFWGGEVVGASLTYSTPENIDGTTIPVERFAGNNGISFSGALESASLDLMLTPGECSDGMSGRTYPFVATLQIGDETRFGCAWTEQQPFTGPQAP